MFECVLHTKNITRDGGDSGAVVVVVVVWALGRAGPCDMLLRLTGP
jgi:hypothetical protein